MSEYQLGRNKIFNIRFSMSKVIFCNMQYFAVCHKQKYHGLYTAKYKPNDVFYLTIFFILNRHYFDVHSNKFKDNKKLKGSLENNIRFVVLKMKTDRSLKN